MLPAPQFLYSLFTVISGYRVTSPYYALNSENELDGKIGLCQDLGCLSGIQRDLTNRNWERNLRTLKLGKKYLGDTRRDLGELVYPKACESLGEIVSEFHERVLG